MSPSPQTLSSRRQTRLWRLMHWLAVMGMVLSTLMPVPVAAANTAAAQSAPRRVAMPANSVPTSSASHDTAPVSSITAAGDSLLSLPGWMTTTAAVSGTVNSNIAQQDLTAASSTSGLGDSLLPAWFGETAQSRVVSSLLAPMAAPQCPSSSDLDLVLTIPSYRVSEGNTTGDVYTLTVTNNATISATEVSLLVDPNVGFYYVGSTAAAVSSNDGALTLVDPGTSAPDAPVTVGVGGTVTDTSLASGETITFTFKLATTDNAPSSQLLSVSLQSGSPTAQSCATTQENVSTGRGNLVLAKTHVVQDAAVGDVVTWTIELKNTGLGNVYDAIMTDTFGTALTNTQISPAIGPVDLGIGATTLYTATALVTSCGELTNQAQASWSIGDEDGTATGANPLNADADVALLLQDPNLSVQVGTLPQVLYCGALTTTMPVTITNTGGTAQQLVLDIGTGGGLVVSNPQPSGDWILYGNQLQYVGGPVAGMIRGGETLTLTVDVASSGNICSGDTGSLQLTPRAYDACFLLQTSGTAAQASTTLGPDAPTLSLSKDSSTGNIAYSGETFVYTVTLSGANITNTTGITVTDVLTNFLQNVTYTVSTGSAVLAGNIITWNVSASNPTIAETLLITATIPDQSSTGTCGAGTTVENSVSAEAGVCPECNLSASANTSFIVLDSLDLSQNSFNMESSPIALCTIDTAAQQFTTTLQVRTGITWTGAIYTDTLGADVFDAPYDVVPGTLQVLIDGVDRTSILTNTLGAPLVVDFSNMSAFGAFSSTADIQITYQTIANPATLVSDPSRTGFVLSYFEMPGPAKACNDSRTAVLGTYVSLQRGNLGIGLAPDTLNSCQENSVTISVTGGNPDPDLLTDHLVVTFTAQWGDVYTPTLAVYGGALTGVPVTVTQTGITTTFAFSASVPITGNGSINFPLFRNCGEQGTLSASLAYEDICPLPREAGPAIAGNTTRTSRLSLYVTPDDYTVYDRGVSWRWYVSNMGDLDATNAVVTNTLPVGYHFETYTATTQYSPPTFLSTISMVTGTVGGQEVVTFTIGTLPVGARVRFDADASITSCVDPAQVDVGLTQTCGLVQNGVNATCSGVTVDHIIFQKGPTALLSSNYQDANIPLCQSGRIRLEVKNASSLSQEYEFVITDTITNATYVTGTAFVTVTNAAGAIVTGTTSGQPLANIPFSPTVTPTGSGQLLTWDITNTISGTEAYDVLAQRAAEDLITILFSVSTDCSGLNAAIQSAVTTRDICDLPLNTHEDSISLLVDAPDLTVSKIAGNLTDASGNTASAFPERIYASAGDTVAFTLTVTNQGDAAVTNLFVTDTLPANITPTLASPGASIASGTVDWGTGGGLTLAVNETKTLTITATVNDAVCSLDGINEVQASYGCSTSDVCVATPVTDTAIVQTTPVLSVQSITGDLLTCGGNITLLLQNDGPPAQNVVLTDTLPAPYVYDANISATTAPATLPTSGDNPAVWTWSTLPTGQTTLVFRVRTTSTVGICTDPSIPVTDQVDVSFTDSCTTTSSYTSTQSTDLSVGTPQLAISKTPTKQSSDVGRPVTWTINITNVGTAIAPNISVTDTLDSGFAAPSATNGSGGNEATTAIIAGNVITWTPAFTLPIGGSWTAQVSAQLLASGQNTNTVQAVGSCGTGCVYDSVSAASHATLLALFDKAPTVQTQTIGSETVFTFGVQLSDVDALYGNLLLTDTLPVGLGYLSSVVTLTYDIDGNNGGPTTTVFASPTVSPSIITPPSLHPSGSIIWNMGDVSGTAAITGEVRTVVQDIAANQQGVSLTNQLDMTYVDDGNLYAYHDVGDVDLLEPTLALDKSVYPTSTQPGATVFYTLTLHHAPTSTIPAYNVLFTDTVPTGLHYVPGSMQLIPASTGTVTDVNAPRLEASFPVITPTYTTTNPIRIRYAAVVDNNATFGSAYTNTSTTTWTSLATNPYTETRNGNGGIDDYLRSANAVLRLNNIAVDKTGPISVTAGNIIFYTITVANAGPDPALNTVLTDTMPFQVNSSAATYVVPGGSNGACIITPDVSGDIVVCGLGTVGANITATARITASVPADVPEAVDLTNSVRVTTSSPDGETTDNTDQTDTEVLTLADVGVSKTGPATATAGEIVSYTIVLSNTGPSVSRGVDAKDLLPSGFTYVDGTSTQGVCVSGICQLGDVGVNDVITMVITATVGSDVTGVVTNTATIFGDTADNNAANDSDTAPTTISALTALVIDKVDLTDPVYAGDTYFYEIVVTNTGPSDAQNVVVTDTLPIEVNFRGASPECTHNGAVIDGTVSCSIGLLAAGESRDFLINTRVVPDVISGTVGTNTTGVTATTPIDLAQSTLTDSETTTYLQPTGGQVDLQISKAVTPTAVVAGQGTVTYTLAVRNNGPAAAAAVQVVDAYPGGFDLLSASTTKDITQSLCSGGATCDLGEMQNGDVVTITLVFAVPADVSADSYNNTAHVGSAGQESNYRNNTASIPVAVTEQADLSLRKVSDPATATPGENLSYTIIVTNTGPSDADNVTVTDTLPADFTPVLILTSQGGCASLPCNLGTLPAGGNASVTIHGFVATDASGSLTNLAGISSSTPDPDSVNNSTSLSTPMTGSADLALDVSSTPTINAGETATITYTVTNNGPSDATNTVVTATFPTGVSAPSGWNLVGGGVYTRSLGTVAVASTQVVTAAVTADNDLQPGTSLQFDGSVGSDVADSDLTNNSDNADTSIIGLADLSLTKSGPTSVNAGEQVTYTIVVTNSGPSVAQSVDVKDALPPNVVLGSASIERSGSGLSACGGTVCQVGDMAVNEVVTITVVGTVDASVAEGTVLTNTATVFSDSPDPDSNDRTDTAATTVATSADLSIAKQANPDPAVPGQSLTYMLYVSNHGPSAAAGVLVTDTLPLGFSLTEVRSTVGGCTSLPCNLGVMPAGGGAAVTLVGMVAADVTSTLTNTAGVSGLTFDPDPTNNNSTIGTALSPLADLKLVADSTPTVNAGETAIVTYTLSNLGPSAAPGAVLTATLPPGATFMGDSLPAGWLAIDNGNGTVTISTSDPIPAGNTVPLPIVIDIDPGIDPGTSLAFSGYVSSSIPDLDPSNNSANTDTSILGLTDLWVQKFSEPTLVTAGNLITYTIVLDNLGPSKAVDVQLVDALPSQVSLISVSATQGSCAGVICFVGDVAAGDTITFTLLARVNPDVQEGEIIANGAVVSSQTPDAGNWPNYDIVGNQVQSLASLHIAKRDMNDPVAPEELLVYFIQVGNDGPGDAQDVVVTDTLPAEVSFVDSTDACVETTPGVLTCQLQTLAAGATVDFLITTRVAADVVTGTVLSNQATVTSTTSLSNSILTASEDTIVRQLFGAPADLAMLKLAEPDPLTAGRMVTYTLIVTNSGPGSAVDVEVIDILPSGLSVVAATPSQGICSTTVDGISCLLGDMLYNGSPVTATVQLIALADSSLPAGSVVLNKAFVRSDQPDPNPNNNTFLTPVTVRTTADLSISKTAAPVAIAGSVLTYTIAITNVGPSDAMNVVFTDTLPAAADFVAGANCIQGPNHHVVCSVGELAAGETREILLAVRPAADASGSLFNQVEVASDTIDPSPTNNYAVETTNLSHLADLSITKSAASDTANAGGEIVYTLRVLNAGPSQATAVFVSDMLPPGVSFVSADPVQTGGPNPLIWSLSDLDVNASRSLTVVVQADRNLAEGTLLHNTANVNSVTSDSNAANNEDQADVQIFTSADIELTKTPSADPAIIGDTLIYTIAVHNNGPSAARDVDVKEQLPPGLTLVDISTSQGTCVSQICQLGTVAVSETAIITVETTVDQSVADGEQICNQAVSFQDTNDLNPANNETEVCTLASRVADLSISKSANVPAVVVNDLLTYTLVITNSGPSHAQGLTVTDTLPVSVTYVSDTDTCTLNPGHVLVCTPGDLLAGESMRFQVVVRVNPDAAGVLINHASVGSLGGPDPTPANNSTTSDPVDVLHPAVVATKAVSWLLDADQSTSVTPGDSLLYTVMITNTGNGPVRDVFFIDTPDSQTTLINGQVTTSQGTVLVGNGAGDSSVAVDVGDIAAGQTVIITYQVIINYGLPLGQTTIVNQGLVSGSNMDDVPTDDPATAAQGDASVIIVEVPPTPTPTATPERITRIRGYVYNRTCDGDVLFGPVTVRLYASNDPNSMGSLVEERLSDSGGFYNFYLTGDQPLYYFVQVVPPVGMSPLSAASPDGDVLGPDLIRINNPGWQVYAQNNFVLYVTDLTCDGTPIVTPTPTSTPTATPTPTFTPTPTPTATPSVGCVEGHKVDELHVGLPNWEIHAQPADGSEPHLITTTDGTGYFRFDNLTPGAWRFWEVMQVGWEAVTSDLFTANVPASNECVYIRFKNRQATATPTPTRTPTATPIPPDTPTPIPNPIYLPVMVRPAGMCEIGRLQVEVRGTFYSFPLTPDGTVKTIKPLDWQTSTVFRLVNYTGPVTWTQYKPTYTKQVGGYEFTYPGTQAGDIFWMFVRTDCGTITIATAVDDPTPTPTPPSKPVFMRSYLPLYNR